MNSVCKALHCQVYTRNYIYTETKTQQFFSLTFAYNGKYFLRVVTPTLNEIAARVQRVPFTPIVRGRTLICDVCKQIR